MSEAPGPPASFVRLAGRPEVLRATRERVPCQGPYRVDGVAVPRVDGIVEPIGQASEDVSAKRCFA